MNGSYRSTLKTLTTHLRPASVVTFIDSNYKHWEAFCLRIIEWYSQMWGGAHNLIVPTDGKTIHNRFWAILERFSPDSIYYYQPSLADTKDWYLEEYADSFRREFETHPSFDFTKELDSQILKRLNPFHSEYIDDHKYPNARMIYVEMIHRLKSPHTTYPLTELIDILHNSKNLEHRQVFDIVLQFPPLAQLFFYTKFGKTAPNFRKNLEAVGFDVQITTYNENNFYKFQDMEKENMPFSMSIHNLTTWPPGREEDPLVLVCGDSVEDFCLYFCLSRMRDEVYWIPETALKNNCPKVFRKLLSRVAEAIFDDICNYNEKRILTTSMTISHEQFKEIKPKLLEEIKCREYEFIRLVKLEDRIIYSESIAEMLPYVWRPFEVNNYLNSYGEQFINGESVNFLNTPRPKNFNPINQKHYWIAELTVEDYQLPVKACLGPLSVRGTTHNVRVSTHGISYVGPDFGLRYSKLHILEPFELFSTLFEDVGLHIRYSDKGNYQREATAKIGSLEALADICKQEHYRNLFDLYLLGEKKSKDEKKSKERDYSKGVFLNSRRYLNLAAIENVVGEHAVNILNVLLEKGILHRGFVFKCERCRNADWYSISEITDTFQCSRCATRQSYLSAQLRLQRDEQRVEPEWFYKLDELFYQGWDNDMYVPILTLAKLQKDAKRSFIYIPEIGYSHDANFIDPEMELDICAVDDGEIVLGECKKSGRLEKTASKEKEVIREYLAIAEKIGTKRLIFSTFQEKWADAMMDNVHELLGGSEIRPEFLTKSELLEVK